MQSCFNVFEYFNLVKCYAYTRRHIIIIFHNRNTEAKFTFEFTNMNKYTKLLKLLFIMADLISKSYDLMVVWQERTIHQHSRDLSGIWLLIFRTVFVRSSDADLFRVQCACCGSLLAWNGFCFVYKNFPVLSSDGFDEGIFFIVRHHQTVLMCNFLCCWWNSICVWLIQSSLCSCKAITTLKGEDWDKSGKIFHLRRYVKINFS